jgi:hypothetical protein
LHGKQKVIGSIPIVGSSRIPGGGKWLDRSLRGPSRM